MTRSRRKTPITGMTSCESEKDDKVRAHRVERRAVKLAVGRDQDPESPRAFGNPWKAGKDGKQYFGDRWPEFMRK